MGFIAKVAVVFSIGVAGFAQASVRPVEEPKAFREHDLDRRGFGFLDEIVPGLGPILSPEVGLYDQRLNHADPNDTRTFKQRYFLNLSYGNGPDSPVIFYICGESTCSDHFTKRFPGEVAKALGANMVALEHRYYGESFPFDTLTTENLAYLTTDNALDDLVEFQKHAMSELGLRGKWISIGGSYPGALSAFYRLKHPELVVGALASSAPVQIKNAFEEYDSHVAATVGPQCAEALRQITRAAEAATLNAETLAGFKARFEAQEVVDTGDFIYLLADITADAVQYGYQDKLCTKLLAVSTAEERVSAYVDYVKDYYKTNGENAVTASPQVALKLGPKDSDGMRQWYYQTCTEYGYWQDGNHDPMHSVRSALINPQYDRSFCERTFGITQLADESRMNNRFYQELLKPAAVSRIYFTNGANDPWSELSINPVRGNDTNPNTGAFLIQGQAHCSDLYESRVSDSASLKAARENFLNLVKTWLK